MTLRQCSRETGVRIERACLFILRQIREDKVPPIIFAMTGGCGDWAVDRAGFESRP